MTVRAIEHPILAACGGPFLPDAIRQLMAPPEKGRRPIGFRVEEGRLAYRRRRKQIIKA